MVKPTQREIEKALYPQRKRQNPETPIMLSCLDFLNVLPGVKVWRQNSGGLKDRTGRLVKFGFTGLADIGGFSAEGKVIQIEVKVPGEEPTPEQQQFLADVLEVGGIAFVVHSIDECERQAELWNLT